MMEALLLGGLLRLLQILGQAAPTILVGLFVAGIFRRMLGHVNTRKLFGSNTWRSLPQAWALGMLLPVCSLGVIPIAREMRRAGISGGAILAFALAAPLFNPLSFLYGLTLSKPLVVVSFALCSLGIVTIIGSVWDRLFPGTTLAESAPRSVPAGMKRMLSILVAAMREASGSSLAYMALGIAGSALLALLLPHGILQRTMNGDNWLAPLSMTGVALPAYSTPMLVMSQIGSMFQHANSPGAAFVLLVFGTGMNLGLLAWMAANYGWQRTGAWLGLLVLVVLGLAYAINGPLYPTDVDPADHTHAFDVYCNPFHIDDSNAASHFWYHVKETIAPLDWYSAVALMVFSAAGMLLNRIDPEARLEAWLESVPDVTNARRKWDIALPVPVLSGLALLGLMAMSVLGCFIYFPAKEDVFEEIKIVRAEALYFANIKDSKRTDHWFGLWDDLTRKLEVGVYLREGNVSEYQHMKARVFREKLELLRHAVEDNNDDEIRIFRSRVFAADRRLASAFGN